MANVVSGTDELDQLKDASELSAQPPKQMSETKTVTTQFSTNNGGTITTTFDGKQFGVSIDDDGFSIATGKINENDEHGGGKKSRRRRKGKGKKGKSMKRRGTRGKKAKK